MLAPVAAAARGGRRTARRRGRSRAGRARRARSRGRVALRAPAEVLAQPLLHRRAEALLRAVDDLVGQQVPRRPSRRTCLPTPSRYFISRRQRQRELHELVVEERLAPLDRARHRDLVEPHEQQLGQPLLELEVGHPLEDVRVRERGAGLVPEALDARVGVRVARRSRAASLERAAEAQRAAPVGHAAVARRRRAPRRGGCPARAGVVARTAAAPERRAARAARQPALERHDEAAVVDVALVAVEDLVGALADLDDDRAGVARELRDEVLRAPPSSRTSARPGGGRAVGGSASMSASSIRTSWWSVPKRSATRRA